MERVGWKRSFSASLVLGVYMGFMVSILFFWMANQSLRSAGKAWISTIIIGTIVLTPILARRERRVLANPMDFLPLIQDSMKQFDEGVNRWRALSHVRNAGTSISIKLRNSQNPMKLVEHGLQFTDQCQIKFNTRDTNEAALRAHVLRYLHNSINSSRIVKKSHSITVRLPHEMDKKSVMMQAIIFLPMLSILGAFAFDEFAPGNIYVRIGGIIAGLFLGIMIITNRGR